MIIQFFFRVFKRGSVIFPQKIEWKKLGKNGKKLGKNGNFFELKMIVFLKIFFIKLQHKQHLEFQN